MEEIRLDIRVIQQVLRKRWKLIAIITILLTTFSGVISYFVITPQYQSSNKVFIGKTQANDPNYNMSDIQMYQQLLKTYSELIRTDDLINKAINKANIDTSVGTVLSGLSIDPIKDTQILVISFKSSDSALCKDVLDAVTKEFISESQSLIPNGTVKIIQDSNVPSYPIGPNKHKNIEMGLIAGFALGVVLAFWLEFINNTVKTKEQLEEVMGIPVIGLIPIETI